MGWMDGGSDRIEERLWDVGRKQAEVRGEEKRTAGGWLTGRVRGGLGV
jgi:hypothetical protein